MSYTQRFQELALMCGIMFPEKSDRVEKYVGGLPDMIQGSVMASKTKTMQEVIDIANDLMDQKVRTFAERQSENKRKLDDNTRNNQNQQQPFKRQNVARAYTAGPGKKKEYEGSLPLCTKCNYHHTGLYAAKCTNCKRVGHLACDCRSPAATANNQRAPGAIQKAGNVEVHGKAYVLGGGEPNTDLNIVTDNSYDVELADGRITGVNTIIRGCTLNLLNHPFNINPMPAELGSFDVIIGMDWLSLYHAVIKNAEDKSEEKRLEDVPVVRDFPQVFPKDLSDERIVRPTARAFRQRLYKNKCLTLGSSGFVSQEERWIVLNVYRLARVEQANGEELLSASKNQ
ncbi:putative reverse transcriptase domain-containing protein [Tanacetum coccineum]